jgi:LPLT family lysophospholipid transporter-like MFS transporter
MKSARNYPLLLASQFLGAFADNAILAVIMGGVLEQLTAGRITPQQQQYDNIWFTSLLFVPYLLLAPVAGYLNDRYPKTHSLLGGNLIKVLGSLLVMVGVARGPGWLAAGYFLVGVGACVYSPAKYGILPEILPVEKLVKANGMVELLTLVAILFGNIVGSVMSDRMPTVECYAVVIGFYVLSLVLNLFMTRTPAYPEVHLGVSFKEFGSNLRELVGHHRLVRVLIGTSLFWICGALMKMNFQPWGLQVLQLKSMTAIALLGLWLSVGVMVGSVLAGRLYRVGDLRHAQRHGAMLAAGLALLGGIQWAIGAGLSRPQPVVVGLLIVTGVFAGLFLIPLNAALQAESHQDKLGKTIATQNLLENAAMLGGSLFAWANVRAQFGPSELFLSLAALVALVVAWLRIPARQAVGVAPKLVPTA